VFDPCHIPEGLIKLCCDLSYIVLARQEYSVFFLFISKPTSTDSRWRCCVLHSICVLVQYSIMSTDKKLCHIVVPSGFLDSKVKLKNKGMKHFFVSDFSD